MQPPQFGFTTSPDIVTPNGSIRFTPSGIVLEAFGNKIEIGQKGIDIRCNMDVNIKGSAIRVNGVPVAR